tara:strand:- start:11 stop:112 length:102 start_codon:yes stop_codon:yes gene_type:complete
MNKKSYTEGLIEGLLIGLAAMLIITFSWAILFI